jgi:hypothetical protein
MIFYLTLLNIVLMGMSSIVTSWNMSVLSMVVSILIITLSSKNLYNKYVSD